MQVNILAQQLTITELETLILLIDQGIVDNQVIISVSARNELILKGLVVKSSDFKYQMVTDLGMLVYLAKFKAYTLQEALKVREHLIRES